MAFFNALRRKARFPACYIFNGLEPLKMAIHPCIANRPAKTAFFTSLLESNFPVDKVSSYAVLWNAFKRIVENFSEDDKDALFRAPAPRPEPARRRRLDQLGLRVRRLFRGW